MSKRRDKEKKLEHGARFNVYINKTVDDELLNFINMQSDLTGANMFGLMLLYKEYGMCDMLDYLPRTYKVSNGIQNRPNINNAPKQNPTRQLETKNVPPASVADNRSVEAEQASSPPVHFSVDDTSQIVEEIKNTSNAPSVLTDENNENETTAPTASGVKGIDVSNMARFALGVTKKKQQ